MTAPGAPCGRPGCSGTIVDGYCDTCGMAPTGTTGATAPAPASTGAPALAPASRGAPAPAPAPAATARPAPAPVRAPAKEDR